MIDEELEELIREVSGKIEMLSNSEKPLTKEEKNRKEVLLLQKETLKRIKEAKKKGNWHQEVRACIDYSLLTELGEKHPFLMYFIRSQSGWTVL